MNILFFLASGEALVRELPSAGSVVVQWMGIMFLVFLNGFFVAAEFALVKVRSSQLEALEQEGNKRAGQSRKALDHLDAYLSATQLGITLSSGWASLS
jgi:CBS domain containing-hemolysin-like protein